MAGARKLAYSIIPILLAAPLHPSRADVVMFSLPGLNNDTGSGTFEADPFSATVTFRQPSAIEAFFDKSSSLTPLTVSTWTLRLSILEETLILGRPDRLTINGSLQHIMGPHGEATGPEATFEFFAFPVATTRNCTSVSHDSHRDTYTECTFDTTNSGPGAPFVYRDIDSYNFRVRIEHVPEPSSLAVLSIGILGLGALLRRHRHRTAAGEADRVPRLSA